MKKKKNLPTVFIRITIIVGGFVSLIGLGLFSEALADTGGQAIAGDLIKTAGSSAIYYLDTNLVKHPFHHEREYRTWYNDFSNIKTVPIAEMVNYVLGSAIIVRPGSRLVQFVEVLGNGNWSVANTPEVYAVGPNGILHRLDSASTATLLYGADWEKMIVPLPNYLFVNYTIGTNLTSFATYPTGTLVKTVNFSQIYYILNAVKRPIIGSGLTANRFNQDYVITVNNLSTYTEGLAVSDYEASLAESYYIPTPLNNGCKVIGCNGEVCVDEDNNDLGTICVWLPWFACYSGAVCERQIDNTCGWTQTAELQQCLLNNGQN